MADILDTKSSNRSTSSNRSSNSFHHSSCMVADPSGAQKLGNEAKCYKYTVNAPNDSANVGRLLGSPTLTRCLPCHLQVVHSGSAPSGEALQWLAGHKVKGSPAGLLGRKQCSSVEPAQSRHVLRPLWLRDVGVSAVLYWRLVKFYC